MDEKPIYKAMEATILPIPEEWGLRGDPAYSFTITKVDYANGEITLEAVEEEKTYG